MTCSTAEPGRKMSSIFERYLTLWVGLCIAGGIVLGKLAPGLAKTLDGMAIFVNGAPVVSIPIAICLFFMMYPIMVKIDFARVVKAGQTPKPVLLTLFINWAVKPFTMFFIATAFLAWFHRMGLITGTEVVKDGSTVELYRSYIAGAILLGIAPCTAMVLVWNYLVRGNDGLTLVMVAINSLTMLLLYGVLGGWLLVSTTCRCRGKPCCSPSASTWRCRWSWATSVAAGSSRPKAKPGFRRNSCTC
jgi:ACR3 family arsenite transporter